MILNSQPISKVVKTYDGTLTVHSIFETIQGEGPFCGTPCVFIRLSGCNLQCPMCDTDYTGGKIMTPNAIVAAVCALRKTGLVVITGGEPFRQPLTELLNALCDTNYYVQVETNGTLPPPTHDGLKYSYQRDIKRNRKGIYIVCSPKTGFVHPDIVARSCCFKYVLSHNSVAEDDGLPLTALGHVANPRLARPPEYWDLPIYLQPEDAQDENVNRVNIEAVVESCLKHGYTAQLQIHKYLNLD